MSPLPPMPPDFAPARRVLHHAARAAGALARRHARAHPRWWHVSLRPRPDGLVGAPLPLEGGHRAYVRLDLRHGVGVLETSRGELTTVSLEDPNFAARLFGAAEILGLDVPELEPLEGDPLPDPAAAAAFHLVLEVVDDALIRHRNALAGAVGPIQLWPHGFDVAFEWFGTRTASYVDDGVATELPTQIAFGFDPADDPYFYANPWPFDPALVDEALPAPARWHTDGWEGTILPYRELEGRSDGVERLLAYFRAVFDVAAPGLA